MRGQLVISEDLNLEISNLLGKVFEVMDIKVLAGLREEWMNS